MKPVSCTCVPRGGRILPILFAALFFLSTYEAGARPIRLRNENINPDSSAEKLRQARDTESADRDGRNVSGLYVIQFTAPPSPAQREQLQSLGVELLRYVPDDAYVVKLRHARPGQLRRTGFVKWLGNYKPEHKLDRRFQHLTNNAVPGLVDVSVLLSPQAADLEADQVKRSFQTVSQESRSRRGRIIRGKLTPAQLNALAGSDSVLWVEPRGTKKLYDEVASKIVAGDAGPNALKTQTLGYTGSGVKVAVADTGLNQGTAGTMLPDLLGRATNFFFYGSLVNAADQHSHGTHVAGIIAGNGAIGETDENGALYGLGVAPGASIIAQRIFSANGTFVPPPSNERLTRDAVQAGADIGSNSWGEDNQGGYDLDAEEFDGLVRDADGQTAGDQPYILEFSAGNAGPGPQTIGSPAVCKNVIATGACQNNRTNFVTYTGGPESMADFSSRGPCEDGRIKPDLVAPGTWVSSLLSQSASSQYAWGGISANYIYMGGTSQAGPLVSGAAAVFVQYYRSTHTNRTPSPALVKAVLINSATDLTGTNQSGAVPNNDEGWGRLNLAGIFTAGHTVDCVDQATLLTNGQTFERHILVADSGEPFKVTLTYTDVPGFAGTIPALVNDLDLEVVAPDGRTYHGNQFNNGESQAGASGRDSINNVEGVLLSQPVAGDYTVRVVARTVAEDARVDSAAVDQDFALASSGHLSGSGGSIVVLDRSAYTAPGTMRITVIDPDKAGSSSVTVLLKSTTESAGENYVLPASGGSGSFTGFVATITGSASVDSRLQIANGNAIEARYFDLSAGSNRIATAVADLVPPVLSSVHITNAFGQTIVVWTSDEPAGSIVRFGTNSFLTRSLTNTTAVTNHAVALTALLPGTNYYYVVVSADAAGNLTTNDNSGSLYTFVAPAVKTVLLVDAYFLDNYTVPPLSGYTDPLNALGVSYDVWDASGGSPAYNDLAPYPVVIWRLPEFSTVFSTWSAPDQATLSAYVNAGGSLLVSSMQVLTRLDDADASGFRRNFLKVQDYVTNAVVEQLVGAPNDPAGSGINTALDYFPYQDAAKAMNGIPDDVSDTITPDPSAAAVYYNEDSAICGLRFPRTGLDSPGRLVFLSYPLDTIPMTMATTNNRTAVLGKLLRFLSPGFDGMATVSLDASAYGIPSLATVEVDDPDQAGNGSLAVTFVSPMQTNAVTLQETTRAGTFRGFLTLVAATNTPTSDTLRVSGGDTVRVTYVDVSSSQTLQVSAVVDIGAPIITGISHNPAYVQATISWTTQEPSDSLVQCGETPLSFRTAFDATLTLNHEVTVQGLNPATLYHYRVVSRDTAGNTSVADNNGSNYTFSTLTPFLPPWSDNLDGSAPGWTVSTEPDSGSHWTRGQPSNGAVTNGHSSPNAWGSNLNGDDLDFASTSLISPAIYLVGGDTATLTFWHYYSFNDDDFEFGGLYILSNNVAIPAQLHSLFTDDSGDAWEQVEVDLSPYIGQVINIVWDYELPTGDPVARTGWFIDDISIVVSNTPPGTLVITNNIWQSHFTINGPAFRSGKGAWLVVTNAPPGQYTVTYSDVVYYSTPSPQTATLNAGGTLEFDGNYTFTDSNGNGMSDLWEQYYFNDVSGGRTTNTDTDTDGLSDFAEFQSGTDPNSPMASLHLTAQLVGGNSLQLSWPTAPGRSYRLLSGTNFTALSPFTGWMLAVDQATNITTSLAGAATRSFYRLEVSPGTIPDKLALTVQGLVGGGLRFDWSSAVDHGYRVLGSTNNTNWAALSAWIQAVGPATTYILSPVTNSATNFFRVEGAP